MDDLEKFVVTDGEGNQKECEVLMNFESADGECKYVVYTDNTLDEDGRYKVYALSYSEVDGQYQLGEMSEEEMDMIQILLDNIEENPEDYMEHDEED